MLTVDYVREEITSAEEKTYVMNKAETEDTCVDVTTLGVAPEEPRNEGGDNEAHEEDEFEVPLVLPANDGVL
jgi:hypothetical protein